MIDAYLPIAAMAVPVEHIVMLGLAVGFLSGVFGVGGGFLTTPVLILMGLPPAIAVGTQANQLVAVSVSGVISHWKKGNVDYKLGLVMLGGSVAGSVVGIVLFRLLQHIGKIDIVIPLLYIGLLGIMGLMMLYESMTALIRRNTEASPGKDLVNKGFFKHLPYKMRFPHSRIYVSALLPAGIGFIGGILVSVMGISGGFILIPAMIYILGMPTLLVAGTCLFQIMVTTIVATLLHAIANHTVDLVLAIILIAGGVVGAQLGVRAARKIRGVHARIILSVLFLLVSFKLFGDLVIPPPELYSTEVR